MTDPTPDLRLEATVIGRVQGVGFRYHVLRAALDLGLRGWVANELDGSVRYRAEGPRPALESLLASTSKGPPGAVVERVIVAWGPATGSLGPFGIRSHGHRGD